MLKIFLLIIYSGFLLTGCDDTPSKEIGYGTISDGVYENSYFKMSIKFPEGWAIQSQAAQKVLMKTGLDIISDENKLLKKAAKAAEKQTVNMFAVFRYKQGAPVEFNPSIMCIAEKVKNMPGIVRGSDYNYHVRKLLESTQLSYDFPDEIYTKEFSGVSFDIMPTIINTGNTTVHQEYYATRINNYILGFILTYTSNDEQNSLNSVIDTLEFHK